MDVELIDKMGSDLTIVNAARVSFDKESDWDTSLDDINDGPLRVLLEKDQKLINFLARHGHWTPFSHVQIQMRETVPIFVARQRFKHMVGFTYNEISRRYVDSPPEFYKPDVWRNRAEDKKQGSSDETVDPLHWMLQVPTSEHPNPSWAEYPIDYNGFLYIAQSYYEHLLERGVAPEQARMVLPQSMYTSYYTTGSLAAWARAYKLRIEETAQKEIQDLAKKWGEIIGGIPELKYSWQALTS